MYIRFSTLLPVAALVAVVAAAPSALEARNSGASCDNGHGELQCCNSTEQSTPSALAILDGLLGLVLPNISGLIGLNCVPITVVGTGTGATCTKQTVCCTDNNYNGLVNLGCTAINIGL